MILFYIFLGCLLVVKSRSYGRQLRLHSNDFNEGRVSVYIHVNGSLKSLQFMWSK